MKANNKGRAFRGEVMWYAGGSAPDKTAQATVGFDIIADGEYHTYTVTPEVAQNFAYADQIARTRLNVPAGVDGVIISKIEQTQLPTDYTPPSK
jgi:predicted fused transcriptional regulator/phosphomethylpyrimidine kinase